ncbi:hypothetical protein DFQ26_003586 [Actinomortierella ambigua]|nr:hypothetical protein DFQ26_003586 [Actinomortierella ambigua]
MTHLNIDILMLIIDNVDNHHTLFSLLTVSKQVFRYTCQRLYRDPGYHLKKTANSATSSFIKMVLALSPATDESTNLLRKIFHVQQADIPPMADYLSYIRVVREWDQLGQYLRDRLKGYEEYADSVPPPPFGSYDSFMTSILIMATCQASKMRELETDVPSIEYFISRASEFPHHPSKCILRSSV